VLVVAAGVVVEVCSVLVDGATVEVVVASVVVVASLLIVAANVVVPETWNESSILRHSIIKDLLRL
jgi:hypothetical protein